MSEVLPLLPLQAFMKWTGKNFTLYLLKVLLPIQQNDYNIYHYIKIIHKGNSEYKEISTKQTQLILVWE
jgi:hypothetical protein